MIAQRTTDTLPSRVSSQLFKDKHMNQFGQPPTGPKGDLHDEDIGEEEGFGEDDFEMEENSKRTPNIMASKIPSPFMGIRRPQHTRNFCLEQKSALKLVRSTFQGGDQFSKTIRCDMNRVLNLQFLAMGWASGTFFTLSSLSIFLLTRSKRTFSQFFGLFRASTKLREKSANMWDRQPG